MSLLATDVMGNPQVGVYLSVVGDVLFHPPMLEAERVEQISSALELEPAPLSVGGSNLIGSLVAGNSHGLAVADIATTEDIDHLTSFGDVVVMEHGVNAAGNLVLCSEQAVLASPILPEEGTELLAEVFRAPVVSTSIAGQDVVGSMAAMNSMGALLHPDVTVDEVERIRDAFEIDVMVGTVAFGSPFIGAGMVASDSGAVVSQDTTGPELNRIEDALGLI